MDIDIAEIRQMCAECQVEIAGVESATGSFDKRLFFINREFLLRVSTTPMTAEQEKFRRVAGLAGVPKILHAGALQREGGPIHYTLLTLLPGDDFVNAYPQTTPAQQKQLGADVARFLDALHETEGPRHDIGLYVPALPQFPGTWREGHQQYWARLEREAGEIPLQPGSRRAFESAFRFLRASAAALDFQAGSRLLHNDFHPKNILLSQGKFSGVIDWECSQYGEADFELCHLVHWCLYPPEPTIDFRPFLRALFAAAPRCTRVPRLAQRLAIYQVEHEMQQILWNPRDNEPWRVPRLARWLDGEDLLREIGM